MKKILFLTDVTYFYSKKQSIMFFSLFVILIFSASSILNGCSIGIRKNDIARAQKIEPTHQERSISEGQAVTDTLAILIANQTGLSKSLLTAITSGTTINYIHKNMDKIEESINEENLLRQYLSKLGEELDNLKTEYTELKKIKENLQNIPNEQREKIKQLNNYYDSSVIDFGKRLINIEHYISKSDKLINKQSMLNKVKEYKNELIKLQ